MRILPRHLAATQYTIIAVFMVAAWWTMLSPIDRAREQLEHVFAADYENRSFFIWLAITTLLTILIAGLSWLKHAENKALSVMLAFLGAILLGIALWRFDKVFIGSYLLGWGLSIWAWRKPNSALNPDTATQRPLA
jgi:magnesium-transporting ATPase (P-type)